MKISYNWLQSYFEKPLPPVTELDSIIALHSFETEGIENVDGDNVIDIDVLPNRAHDCLSHMGIAKEVSALLGDREIIERYKHDKEYPKSEINLDVDIQNTEKCRRYMGRVIENIKIGETPDWIKNFLTAVGQQSINNVVDATNFVMLDLGNPIHAFDLDKLSGPKIIIRNAETGEGITTLGQKADQVELDDSMLVIADETDPLAIAGIKGGNKAEVDSNTTNIVLEVANFEPISTRETRKKTGIATDSSKRFENELSPEIMPDIMERLTLLILEIAGTDNTKLGNIVDVYPTPTEPAIVSVELSHINTILGLELKTADVTYIFDRLNFTYTETDGRFSVSIPTERLDLRIPQDLIEEIGRVYGYENIPTQSLTDIPFTPAVSGKFALAMSVRQKLLADGYNEVMTYTFTDHGKTQVKYSADDKNFLRANLTDGLTVAFDKNKKNAPLFGTGPKDTKMFEIGTVWTPTEQLHIAIADAKGIQETTLEKYATDNNLTGADYNFNQTTTTTFTPWSPYPFTTRDISVWVPSDVTPESLEAIYGELGEGLLVRMDQVDKYEKDDRVSYAYRLVFQSMDRTLTDDEITPITDAIYKKLTDNGWEVR
ncbi:MAG: phenylalanine--tRNA ligase subunit beta [Candidatus Heimdallarchaeota archaeon]|nr:phenylalanine--tRNA ligase subunit beta [Candidatus Nomurabacteria bacterium]MDH5647727.1 phenylalanine--tRNA ligase subunit beta [Candidatus Heimdallarchaeota archaeon]